MNPLRARDSHAGRLGSWNLRGHMYIDPTAGSLVLQVLAAGALSAVALFSRLREGLKHFFRSLSPRRWAHKR